MNEENSNDQQPETSRQGISPREQSSEMLVRHGGSSDDQQPETSRQCSSFTDQLSGSLENETGRSGNNERHDQQQAFHQVDVPIDNSCLFWAVAFAYLIPVRAEEHLFRKRYEDLFGSEAIQRLSSIRTSLLTYNYFHDRVPVSKELSVLITATFRNRVVNHMSDNRNRYEEEFAEDYQKHLNDMRNCDTWGGEPEIKAMSDMLYASISVSAGPTETKYSNGKTRIQLFHVTVGAGGVRNHYNFGLEQSIIDSHKKRFLEETITKLENYDNHFTDNPIDSINNDEIPLDKETVQDYAKIKWYGSSDVIFKVTSVGRLSFDLKKPEGEEMLGKFLAVIIELNDSYWVTLVINYKEPHFYGHYVDSLGEKLPDIIKDAFTWIIGYNFNDCTIINRKHTNKINSGVHALKDAECIITKLQGKSEVSRQKSQIQKQFKNESYYPSKSPEEDTITKLGKESFENYANSKWYGNSNVILKVTSVDHLSFDLKKPEAEEIVGKFLAVIIDLNDGYWVTLVINYKESQLYGHYVDSLGKKLPDTIKSALRWIIGGNFNDCTIIGEQRTTKINSGLYALKDAECIIETLQSDSKGEQSRQKSQIQAQFNNESYYPSKSLEEDTITKLGKGSFENYANSKWYGNRNVILKVTSVDHLSFDLKKPEAEEIVGKFLAVIIDLNNGYWVTLVINYKESQLYGHYVDSLGEKLPDTIKYALRWITEGNFNDCTIIGEQRTTKIHSEMYALKDAECIIETLQSKSKSEQSRQISQIQTQFKNESYYPSKSLEEDTNTKSGKGSFENYANSKWYGNRNVILKVTSVDHLSLDLKKPEAEEIVGKFLAVIIDLNNGYWVTLVINYKESQLYGHYVDSLGEKLPDTIKYALRWITEGNFNDCTIIGEQRTTKIHSEMYALKDAECIIETLQSKSKSEQSRQISQIQTQFKNESYYPSKSLEEDTNTKSGKGSFENYANSKWYGNRNVILKVTSVDHLSLDLKKPEAEEIVGKFLAVIIDLNNGYWVTLVINYKESQLYGHYVDSLGEKLPDTIKYALRWITEGNFNDCTIIGEQRTTKIHSEMYALKDAECIMKILQDNVVLLSQLQKKFNSMPYYPSSLEKYTNEFAIKRKQKVKIEKKIEVCSEMLKKIKPNENKIENFTYENANIFLFCLEAISLVDSPDLKGNYLNKVKDKITGAENSALAKKIRNDLFLHSNYVKVINEKNLDQEFKKLVKDNVSTAEFFQGLADYMSKVCENLNDDGNYDGQDSGLNTLLKETNEIDDILIKKKFGKVVELSGDQILEELSNLFKNCITQIGKKQNVLNGEEIMFNLVVNIIPILEKIYSDSRNKLPSNEEEKKPPILGKKRNKPNTFRSKGLEKIRTFRNNVFHNFHAHGESALRRNSVVKQGMYELLEYIFTYYFVRRVCKEFKEELKEARVRTSTFFGEEISILLESTQNTLREYYLANQYSNIICIIRDDKSDQYNFIGEYLKLMSVIDNEYVIKERERKCQKNKNQVILRRLNVIDRICIYNKFKTLKESEEKEIHQILKTEYDILLPNHYVEQMLKYYKAGDNPLTKFAEIVNNNVSALGSIKKDYDLSTQQIIEIYDTFIKGEEISNLLDKLQLMESVTSSIIDKLCGLRTTSKTTKLPPGYSVKNDKHNEIDVVVDLAKTTINCLEMLDDHILYPFLSMKIEEIFSNELFLDYLLNEEIGITGAFVTKLLNVRYMTPYVAKLMIANKLTDITTKNFSDLIANLLKDMNGACLKNLLDNVSNEQFMKLFGAGDNTNIKNVKDTVYEQICNEINKDNIRIMYCLFETPEYVAGILRALRQTETPKHVAGNLRALTQSELEKETVRLLKNTVAKFYSNEKYDLVLELLRVKEVDDLLTKKSRLDFDVLHILRTKAQAENKNDCHQNALEIYDSILSKIPVQSLNTSDGLYKMEDVQANKLYLLVACDIAYTKHLMRKYKESCTSYKDLYRTVMKQLEISEFISEFSCEIYEKFVSQSETYPNNLVFDSKYLNILKIVRDIAYELGKQGSSNEQAFDNDVKEQLYQEALRMYEVVYKIKATYARFSQVIVKSMRDIAFVSNKLGQLKSCDPKHEASLKQALSHYNKAFEMYATVLHIQEKEQWRTHPANSKTVQDIVYALRNIARINNYFGCIKKSQNNPVQALKYHELACLMYRQVLENTKRPPEQDQDQYLETLSDIAYTNRKLGELKFQNNVEALKHSGEACEILTQVLEIQKKTLGVENEKTKKTERNLKNTKAWFSTLVPYTNLYF